METSKKFIDVAVDIETLSLAPNAAIISIAAVPFWKSPCPDLSMFFAEEEGAKESGSQYPFLHYYEVVNATSCALMGMDFDSATVDFWYKQSDEAKAELMQREGVSLRMAMDGFVSFLEMLKEKHGADIVLWVQGMSFDIPVIENAIHKTLSLSEMPWRYFNVRDSRTYILEKVRESIGDDAFCALKDPYSALGTIPVGIKHSALGDVVTLIHRVNAAYNLSNPSLPIV